MYFFSTQIVVRACLPTNRHNRDNIYMRHKSYTCSCKVFIYSSVSRTANLCPRASHLDLAVVQFTFSWCRVNSTVDSVKSTPWTPVNKSVVRSCEGTIRNNWSLLLKSKHCSFLCILLFTNISALWKLTENKEKDEDFNIHSVFTKENEKVFKLRIYDIILLIYNKYVRRSWTKTSLIPGFFIGIFVLIFQLRDHTPDTGHATDNSILKSNFWKWVTWVTVHTWRQRQSYIFSLLQWNQILMT